MSELDDPIRVFERDPLRAVGMLIALQIQDLDNIGTRHDLLTKFLEDRRVLHAFPVVLKNDPIELAKMLSGFRSIKDIFVQVEVSMIAMGMVLGLKDELTEILKKRNVR
jgi:hypothetical protein